MNEQNTNIKFALFGNAYQIEKSRNFSLVLQILKKHEAYIAIEESFYLFLKKNNTLPFEPDEVICSRQFSADYAISIGGDGTFLKCAEQIGNKNIPIIGINTGRLGFLADINMDEIEKTIDNIYEGAFQLQKRSVLQVKSSQLPLELYPFALNEIAILKHDNASMISIEVNVDETYLNTYQSDGLIVCTPTGSTGYSLSVGGPIISPLSNSIALTAIAPHSLNIRPIVLNNDCHIEIKINSRNHNYLLSVDGRSQSLSDDVTLSISKAPYDIIVLRKSNDNYFETLRGKLMWGADKRK